MSWQQKTASPARGAQLRSANAVLGADHPLVCATEALQRSLQQWLAVAVAVVVIGSITGLAVGRRWGSLVASATVVLLGLTVALAGRRQTQRDCALAVILECGEGVPVTVVQRQCRRLSDPRTRMMLARSLASVIEQALSRRVCLASRARPLFDPAVISAVVDDLRRIMQRLDRDDASVPATLLVERLLAHACSPLYGSRSEPLREELQRISVLGRQRASR